MRTLAIGDIHGCFDAFSTLVKNIPVAPDDLLVTLGDYIDRGPRTPDVLDWLIRRFDAGRLIPLKGNHEIMLLEAADSLDGALADWKDSGGDTTLSAYAGNNRNATLADIPDAHWNFIRSACRDYYETQTHFFVHANAYADVPIAGQPEFMLFWEKFHNRPAPHESGKTMICGHTPQPDSRPHNIGHAVCIDTGVYKNGGWLTALDVATGRYWQANEKRQFRSAHLDAPSA